jgi:hypothetical protein
MDLQKDQSRKSVLLHVCVNPGVRQTLDSLAYHRRESVSTLIREALSAYLENPPRDVRPPPSPVMTERVAQ